MVYFNDQEQFDHNYNNGNHTVHSATAHQAASFIISYSNTTGLTLVTMAVTRNMHMEDFCRFHLRQVLPVRSILKWGCCETRLSLFQSIRVAKINRNV